MEIKNELKTGNPEISVIVPVYNVEKYLRESLDSILSQTFSNIEIICVNDGSTDKSREILEEYKNKDSRIKIVDKKNGGLSSARNAGLKVATGEYISFIDSDDWIEPDMLEKLYNSMTSLDTDITICAVHQFDEQKQEIDDSNPYYTLENFDETFDNRAFSYKDTIPFIMDVCVMAWNKLYRRSLIDRCKAEFPDGKIFEDGPFFFTIFFKTQRVSIVRDFLYNYRINRKGSIVQRAGKKFLDIIDVVEMMYNEIKDIPEFDEIKNEFYIRKADDIAYRYQLVNFFNKFSFSKKLRTKKFLFDPEIFDFNYVEENKPYLYINILAIKDKTTLLKSKYNKLRKKYMHKIVEILNQEKGYYFFKYRKIKIKIKRFDNIFNIWYENDRIHILLFDRYKFSFKFEYSKLEKTFK